VPSPSDESARSESSVPPSLFGLVPESNTWRGPVLLALLALPFNPLPTLRETDLRDMTVAGPLLLRVTPSLDAIDACPLGALSLEVSTAFTEPHDI